MSSSKKLDEINKFLQEIPNPSSQPSSRHPPHEILVTLLNVIVATMHTRHSQTLITTEALAQIHDECAHLCEFFNRKLLPKLLPLPPEAPKFLLPPLRITVAPDQYSHNTRISFFWEGYQ